MENKSEVNIILHLFARFCFWVIGWKVDGEVPQIDKAVIIAAPHTANMDGILMVLTSWIARRKLQWMVKIEWTRGIVGWFVRQNGGVGIDRSGSFGMVEQAIQEFKVRDRLMLAVPPEGTRRHTDHWKTGFYWIAYGAHVPMLPVRLNYGTKTVDLTLPEFVPTGDIEADMEIIWQYYEGVKAKYPEKFSDRRLRPSGIRVPKGIAGANDESSITE